MKASLHEKEVLLVEIHHRVKNNLYIVSSLLELQMDWVSDPHPQAQAALENSCNRISSIVMMFVEQLMGKLDLERGDITWFKIDF